MRYSWKGVRWVVVVVTSLLLVLSPASTGTETRFGSGRDDSSKDSLRPMPSRVRRQSPVNLTSTPRGWTSQCSPQCFGNVSAQQLKRNYRLDSVKDDILRKLRMNETPNVTGRMLPNTSAMQSLVNQINHEPSASGYTSNSDTTDMDRVSPTTLILLSQTVPPDKRSGLSPASSACYFTVSPDFRMDQVISAHLGIFIHLRNTAGHIAPSPATLTWLLVYRINRHPDGRFHKTLQRRRKISLTPQDTGMWQKFDVRVLIEHWMNHPEQNYGIQIMASDHQGIPLAALPTSNQTEDALRPYIEVEILNQSPSRSRRSTSSDCLEASGESRCCRYPLSIDFGAFGWDWIIAPRRYEAYYCSGECPFLYYQRQTHTHIVSQLTGGLGVPCCAPTLMSSLQMIYLDSSQNIIFGTLPGMIVEKCGCS